MEVKPYTPIGKPDKISPELEAIQEDPQYLSALNEVEKVQDRFDRIDTLLKLSPRQRIKGLPQKKAELWDPIDAKLTPYIKYATYGLMGAGFIAGFFVGSPIIGLGIGIATMIAAAKGVPRKVAEKLFIEPRVDRVVKRELNEEKGKIESELAASRSRLKEAEAAALKRHSGHVPRSDAVINDDSDDSGQISIGGLKLDKNS